MTRFENWGDYFWPGQIDECRINKLGIRDPDDLERHERVLSAGRAAEIAAGAAPIARTYDLAHLRAIHRQLFQDVYDWAGQPRVTELVRPAADPEAPANEFAKPGDIPRLAELVFDQLGDPARLRDRPTPEVVDQLARTYAGVNVLHPFVEGNGRAQRIFLDQVAEQAGHRIHWDRIADRQNDVMAQAFGVGPEPVRQALSQCVERLPGTSAGAGPGPGDAARRDTTDALRCTQDGLPAPSGPAPSSPPATAPVGYRHGPHQNRDQDR